jgi:hypothetical protein
MPHWIRGLISATAPIQILLAVCRQKRNDDGKNKNFSGFGGEICCKHGVCSKFLLCLCPSCQDI